MRTSTSPCAAARHSHGGGVGGGVMTGSSVIGLLVSNVYRPSRVANLYTKQTALDAEADAGVVLGVAVTVDPSFLT